MTAEVIGGPATVIDRRYRIPMKYAR